MLLYSVGSMVVTVNTIDDSMSITAPRMSHWIVVLLPLDYRIQVAISTLVLLLYILMVIMLSELVSLWV